MSGRFESPYHIIERQVTPGVYGMLRSAEPYPDIDAMKAEFAAMRNWILADDAPRIVLVIDVRQARGRNDDAFEAAMAPVRQQLLRDFEWSVFIVSTLAGKLQALRFARGDGLHAQVYLDEADARAFVARLVAAR